MAFVPLSEKVKSQLLAAIEKEMIITGISQSEIARQTGLIRNNVNRALQQSETASIKMLLVIAEALGLDVDLKFKKCKPN